nr:restriction endonuclease subunit S [Acidobacteriota bacterium]
RINPADIFNLTVTLPPQDKILEFDEIIRSQLRKIRDNQNQIRTLTQLRDTLLPKLMSGAVRVA